MNTYSELKYYLAELEHLKECLWAHHKNKDTLYQVHGFTIGAGSLKEDCNGDQRIVLYHNVDHPDIRFARKYNEWFDKMRAT